MTTPIMPVMTREQAMAYAGIHSVRTFRRWCTRHRVKPLSRDRYSTQHLARGLTAEAAKTDRRA